MVSVPQNIVQTVRKYSSCPDAIWQTIVYLESSFNPAAIGDGPSVGGYSYGLFQLHVGNNGIAGQGNAAISYINRTYGLTGQDAVNLLLKSVDIQCQFGMPAINNAWNSLRNSYNAKDRNWWLQFCAASGHPGGSPTNGVTQAFVDRVFRQVINTNQFGIQQLQAGAGANVSTQIDKTWLNVLINNPPHQPCSVVWRRTCPGAKAANEGGMDLDSPAGTKVYALGDGHVVGAGYFWHPNGNPGHGVVTIRTTLPDGSLADIYYQHITLSPAIVLCGQTGGQLYGGVVGPAPTFQQIKAGTYLGSINADVGEVEVGINADWGGIWGTNHPGPWIDDPENIVRSLMQNGGGQNAHGIPVTTGNINFDTTLSAYFDNTQESVKLLTQFPGINGPVRLFDKAQQFKPFIIPTDQTPQAQVPVLGGIEQGASLPVRVAIGGIGFLLSNAIPFFIRSFFVLFALVVIVALIINITSSTVTETLEGDEGSQGGNQLPLKAIEMAAL